MGFMPSSTDYTYADFERIDLYPTTYQEFLDAPCKIINLDRNVDRFNTSLERIHAAGFTNVSRFSAVNAKDTDALRRGWEMVGFPNIAYRYDMSIMTQLGVQGCFLSHFAIWKEIIDNKIPYMMVFEDDVLFHSKWHELCPQYFEHTPKDYEIIYLGNRNDNEKTACIHKNVPVYCTHAMLLTYNGVKKLWDMLLNLSIGVYPIDDMIRGAMIGMKNTHPMSIYTWNVADFFPCDLHKMSFEWTRRNNGLVFQDEIFGTDVNIELVGAIAATTGHEDGAVEPTEGGAGHEGVAATGATDA